MTARLLRDQARLRAQGHKDQLSALIDDSDLDDELKDAMRMRLSKLWTEASLAMTLVHAAPPQGGGR